MSSLVLRRWLLATSLLFSRRCLEPKFVFSPLPKYPDLILWGTYLSAEACSCWSAQVYAQGAGHKVGRITGLALGVLGVLTGQVGGHPWFKFLQQLMSSLPAGVMKTFSWNCVSLMPFRISYLTLFCSYFPSHEGPALILWMLWEKNRFLQLCDAQLVNWGLIHSFPFPHSNSYITPKECRNLYFKSLDFCKAFVSMVLCCPNQNSPGFPWMQPQGAEVCSPTPAGSTASTEACLPFTWLTGGQDFSWVPWCIVLSYTIPTKVLLFRMAPNLGLKGVQ